MTKPLAELISQRGSVEVRAEKYASINYDKMNGSYVSLLWLEIYNSYLAGAKEADAFREALILLVGDIEKEIELNGVSDQPCASFEDVRKILEREVKS